MSVGIIKGAKNANKKYNDPVFTLEVHNMVFLFVEVCKFDRQIRACKAIFQWFCLAGPPRILAVGLGGNRMNAVTVGETEI